MIDWNNIDKKDFCAALLEATPIPVLVVNPEVKILYFNSLIFASLILKLLSL